jgi:hypothetical protein
MQARRRLLFAAIVALFAVLPARAASAQSAEEPMPFTSYPFASLREALFRGVSLTPKQTDEAFGLTKSLLEEMDAQSAKMKTAPDSIKRARVAERSKEHAAALRKILTDRQRPRFDSNYVALQNRQRARRR